MRDYQRKKNNPYELPKSLYKRMIDLVRDYERIKRQRDDIINSTPEHDGVSSNTIGNPTENKAIKLAILGRDCEAVEKALAKIPKEYHKGIMNNIIYHARYPYTASERTYGYQKSRFIYFIAKNLYLI